MADNFGDLVDERGWNSVERGIMWIWWEYIDPLIGSAYYGVSKDDPSIHSYLTWATKGMITIFIPMFLFTFIFFILWIKNRGGKKTIVKTEPLTAETMEVKDYGPVTREDKIEILRVLRIASSGALEELEKNFKKKKLTEPAYQKTKRTLTLQIQKIDNTINKTEGAHLRDLYGDSSGVVKE